MVKGRGGESAPRRVPDMEYTCATYSASNGRDGACHAVSVVGVGHTARVCFVDVAVDAGSYVFGFGSQVFHGAMMV